MMEEITFPLLDLPVEMIEHIVSKMKLESLKTISRTNKLFYCLTEPYIVEKCSLNIPLHLLFPDGPRGSFTLIEQNFQRKYKSVHRIFNTYNKHVRVEFSNGILTKIFVKAYHDIDVRIARRWNNRRDCDPIKDCYCARCLIGNFLHVNVNTSSQAQHCLSPHLFFNRELCKLNIVSKTPQDVWKVAKQWSFFGKLNALQVTMETYSEAQHDYQSNEEKVESHLLAMKNTGDVNLIKRLVSRDTKVLELEDCKTDFKLEYNGLESFVCFNKETVNIDRILSQQTSLSCVLLNHVAITEALLRILKANTLYSLRIFHCHIEGEIHSEMFLFVKRIIEVGLVGNPVPLSAFIWNNLQDVKNLGVGLKEATGLEKKTLNSLRVISYGPEEEETTRAIVEKLLDKDVSALE